MLNKHMKNIISILTVLFLASCMSQYKKEALKSAKQGSASQRINSSAGNSESIFKELD